MSTGLLDNGHRQHLTQLCLFEFKIVPKLKDFLKKFLVISWQQIKSTECKSYVHRTWGSTLVKEGWECQVMATIVNQWFRNPPRQEHGYILCMPCTGCHDKSKRNLVYWLSFHNFNGTRNDLMPSTLLFSIIRL